MKFDKKRSLLLELIIESRETIDSNHDVPIYYKQNADLSRLDPSEIVDCLNRIQSEGNVLKLVEPLRGSYMVNLLPGFDKYCQSYVHHELSNPIKDRASQISENKIALEIVYTPNREIKMYSGYFVKTFKKNQHLNSDLDLVFNFLYEHPNQIFTQNEVMAGSKASLDTSFNQMVEKFGFKGVWRRIFFDVSKDAIKFKNPCTIQMLKSMLIDPFDLSDWSPPVT